MLMCQYMFIHGRDGSEEDVLHSWNVVNIF